MVQALLGFVSEARWLRFARVHLLAMFPALPRQPGWNKRLRKADALLARAIRMLAADTAAVDRRHLACSTDAGGVRLLALDGQAL